MSRFRFENYNFWRVGHCIEIQLASAYARYSTLFQVVALNKRFLAEITMYSVKQV